jgi:thioredoxin reductase (NADPH)
VNVGKIDQDLLALKRIPLAASHIAAIRKAGTEVRYAAGVVLVRPGDAVENFVYVEEGERGIRTPDRL